MQTSMLQAQPIICIRELADFHKDPLRCIKKTPWQPTSCHRRLLRSVIQIFILKPAGRFTSALIRRCTRPPGGITVPSYAFRAMRNSAVPHTFSSPLRTSSRACFSISELYHGCHSCVNKFVQTRQSSGDVCHFVVLILYSLLQNFIIYV